MEVTIEKVTTSRDIPTVNLKKSEFDAMVKFMNGWHQGPPQSIGLMDESETWHWIKVKLVDG